VAVKKRQDQQASYGPICIELTVACCCVVDVLPHEPVGTYDVVSGTLLEKAEFDGEFVEVRPTIARPSESVGDELLPRSAMTGETYCDNP
jgi:hypothetical protein